MMLLDIITSWKSCGLVVSLLRLEDSINVTSPSVPTVTLPSSTDCSAPEVVAKVMAIQELGLQSRRR